MRLSLSVRFRSDPSTLPSPFYYAGGTVPCFVAVGDLSQMMFMGVAPPNFISSSGSDKEADAVTSARRCLQQQEQELLSQPIVKYRFCCSAHPRVPDCCKSVMGCLDAFQLHLGRQSRVRQDQFEGVCVSVQRTFKLVPPRRYSMNPELPRVTHKDIRCGETALTWSDVIRRENELLLSSLGPGIFSFGTGTAPLRGIYFTFQWEQLRDTEVRDDGERISNLDPFAPEEKLVLTDKLVISAVAIPKDDYELNHAACKNISKYMDAVMEYLATGGDTGSKQTCMTGELMDMADSIVDNNVHDLSEQKIFIDRVSALLMRRDEVKQDIRNTYFPGSLFCRFAHGCATLLENVQHVHTLWRFVVQRLKSLLESDGDRQPLLRRLIAVIGIPPVDEIDHTMPLIVQKLQLLVICARRLLKEEVVMPTEKAEDGCEDGFGAQSLQARGRMRPNVGAASMDSKCENTSIAKKPMRLITNGELLEVPPPLPTPPYTTDILLVKGREEYDSWTSSGSQYVQAVGLSEGLLNDMCLFLYVNKAHEGRVVRFPDFVQWYSPRDFVLPPVQPEISCDDVGNSEHKAIDGCAVIDDNMFLSERMQRRPENTWWGLWEQATPRTPKEIIDMLFVPDEQANEVICWMESDLALESLLLDTINANFANVLHPLLSHRYVEDNRMVKAYVTQRSEEIAASIRSVLDYEPLFMDMEALNTSYCVGIRLVGEIETCLCVALAIERCLCTLDTDHRQLHPPAVKEGEDGKQQQQHQWCNELETISHKGDCQALTEFVATLSSPLPRKAGDAPMLPLCLHKAPLPWAVWRRCRLFERFSEDERMPVTTYLRATCMAERPLNTTPCFQQMIAETDEKGVFRMALTLGEEVL
uniref:Rab3 GTPase-activating protein catalytic subunit n=1 Tax=Trypanosoma congolense (strain IL3000) TaxID=1068625 RepID=F9WK22_TRYCI|nr:unnamed protein product [Trypanosoma congolense IL3000]